mmetsp:Transcript_41315/g.108513  ORF Transcript_41315/g.108513 Transcript_41315/m.108513 type:complete len:236 (+) Transcript_41315:431-1138(+)
MRNGGLEPGVVQELLGRRSLSGVEVQHGLEELRKRRHGYRVLPVPENQRLEHSVPAQLLDVAQCPVLVKVHRGPLPRQQQLRRHGAAELEHLRQVVLFSRHLRPVRGFAALRVEEVVPGHELVQHACQGPNIRGSVVARQQQDLRRSVLSRLNVVGEVLMGPTRIPKVSHLVVHLVVVEDVETWRKHLLDVVNIRVTPLDVLRQLRPNPLVALPQVIVQDLGLQLVNLGGMSERC